MKPLLGPGLWFCHCLLSAFGAMVLGAYGFITVLPGEPFLSLSTVTVSSRLTLAGSHCDLKVLSWAALV